MEIIKIMSKNYQYIKCLYRYREATKYNIDAFCKDYINGSLFSEFLQYGELNFEVPHGIFVEYGIDSVKEEEMKNSIIKNACNNYYMACLTINPPTQNEQMWREYANNNGFCLVYSVEDIKTAIVASVMAHMSIELLKVNYSDTPYDLSILYEPFVKAAYEYRDRSLEELESIVAEIAGNIYSKEIGKYVVQSFAHKKARYKNEKEYRLVLQCKPSAGTPNPKWKVDMLKVRPIKIVIMKSVVVFDRDRLIKHAKEIAIPFEIV